MNRVSIIAGMVLMVVGCQTKPMDYLSSNQRFQLMAQAQFAYDENVSNHSDKTSVDDILQLVREKYKDNKESDMLSDYYFRLNYRALQPLPEDSERHQLENMLETINPEDYQVKISVSAVSQPALANDLLLINERMKNLKEMIHNDVLVDLIEYSPELPVNTALLHFMTNPEVL